MYEVDSLGNAVDWNVAAVEAADRIHAHRLADHNGAAGWWKPGIFVAFGNDGYSTDENSRAAVDLLRQRLEDRKITELGFGVDSNGGYTWAMLVQTEDYLLHDAVVVELAAMVTEARRIAKGVGFDAKDENWEAYKGVQGLFEPRDLDEIVDALGDDEPPAEDA